jgi:chaperone modulatory protein CbpM
MTITETEIVARFNGLETHVLERWIAAGWLKPDNSGEGYLFDEADVARTHLLCDLSFDLELQDEELELVLSLIDRLNGMRTMLSALTAAVQSQPAAVRSTILGKMRAMLEARPPAL